MLRTLATVLLLVLIPAACFLCLWLALLAYTHTPFGV
jgi:hypothetical protein